MAKDVSRHGAGNDAATASNGTGSNCPSGNNTHIAKGFVVRDVSPEEARKLDEEQRKFRVALYG